MYDAIVIGARVAGAPTAMQLARKGYRVLLVDRASFPSDMMSTHFIHAEGIARLKRWGLLDRVVATNVPLVTEIKFDVGIGAMAFPVMPYDGVADVYCPRRTVLDAILVDAAVEAGAELRKRFLVQELIMDGDHVTGVRGRAADGSAIEEQARVVIGADGMHSLVARAVQAPEYNNVPALGCGYYAYFSGPDIVLGPVEFYIREKLLIFLFPTNDGQACIGVYWPVGRFHEIRTDIGRHFQEAIAVVPALAERVHRGKQEERFIGTADVPNFYRRPYGPGWALAGDAGYHKDPVTGWGITDAFRDADLLSQALDDGFAGRRPLEEALAGYEQQRNELTADVYQQTLWLASLPSPMEVVQRFTEAAAQPAAQR